jgi:predicted aconitase
VKLTDAEKAMLDGVEGPARQRAMDLLVRYGEALGAERLLECDNVAGVPGSSSRFVADYYKARAEQAGASLYETVFSLFDLDADEVVPVPKVTANSCHLQGGIDPVLWREQGASEAAVAHQNQDEAAVVDLGIKVLKTCTPYLAGNEPRQGEHCAWMESSAVVFCNSVLGARTNTEGRESTSAAMLTKRIPDFALHQERCRRANHLIEVEAPVSSVYDWGMLGYFVGEQVEEDIPVITGAVFDPQVIKHKHFGAAAASSGGIELYHMVGITPEAPSLEAALGGNTPRHSFRYGAAERRATWEALNSNGRDQDVDYVMLGCPHAALEQVEEAARMLEGRKLSPNCRLWVFTSRVVKLQADARGLTKAITDAGGLVMTDTCSAIGQVLPPHTKVVALDSAKQAHYLPAIMGIQAWFGTTAECIGAALTGRWDGAPP